jgi:hypothetical protein
VSEGPLQADALGGEIEQEGDEARTKNKKLARDRFLLDSARRLLLFFESGQG